MKIAGAPLAKGPMSVPGSRKLWPTRVAMISTRISPIATMVPGLDVTAFGLGMTFLRLNIDTHRDQNHDAFHDELIEIRNTEQVHPVVDDADNQRTDQRPGDRSVTARETRSAEHGGGDGIEFIAYSRIRLSGIQTRRHHNAPNTHPQARDHENHDSQPVYIDTRIQRRLAISAREIRLASKYGTREHEVVQQQQDRENPDRQRNAEHETIAEEGEAVVVDRNRHAVRREVCKTAKNAHGGDGDDERWNPSATRTA